jgi:hypothetical protein
MDKTFSSKRFWWGLICILIIYSLFYLIQADNNEITHLIPYKAKVAGKIIVVFLVYITGSYFLKELPQQWLLNLWHVIHIFLISILLSLWVWHYIIQPLPLHIRRFGFSIHEFLISPLLYLATGIVGRLEGYYRHVR